MTPNNDFSNQTIGEDDRVSYAGGKLKRISYDSHNPPPAAIAFIVLPWAATSHSQPLLPPAIASYRCCRLPPPLPQSQPKVAINLLCPPPPQPVPYSVVRCLLVGCCVFLHLLGPCAVTECIFFGRSNTIKNDG